MTHFSSSFRQAGARVAFALISGGLVSIACSNSNSSPGPINLGTGGTDAGSGGTAASTGGSSGASTGGKAGGTGGSSGGGTGGSSGSATGGKDGGSTGGGSTGGAGGDGGPVDSGTPPCTLGEGDGGCIRCPPKSTNDFLNQCTSSTCYPFDNVARLPRYNNGTLPTL